MKRVLTTSSLLAITVIALSGCTTYQTTSNRQAMRQREDVRQAQERLRRVSGDMETLQMEIERLTQEVAQLQQLRDNDIIQLETKIQQLAATQASDKKEIIAALSKQIEQLIKTSVPSAPSAAGQSEYGIEHVVRPGETLSAIAKAYGVSSRAIISANQLKNPDRLGVGQKLFIPQ